ncbi:hypothetical protein QM042_01890 [Escherichia coli]
MGIKAELPNLLPITRIAAPRIASTPISPTPPPMATDISTLVQAI